VMALLAEANLRGTMSRAEVGASTGTSDVLAVDVAPEVLEGADAWHIDPDRRPEGRRTTRVELHEPGPEMIDRLLERVAAGAVKLAPAAELPARWSDVAELEWISR
jgi:hypothetical protein